MKLKNRKRAAAPEEQTPSGLTSSWKSVGTDEIDQRVRQQKALTRPRPPEFWLPDGATARLRFRTSQPIASINEYTVGSGRNFRKYTAPPLGTPDAFAERGLRAKISIVWEVVDLLGYVDKKTGKRLKNIPRFWAMSNRVYETIKQLVKRQGAISTYDVEVTRSGTGVNTTYSLFADKPSPPSLECKKAKSLAGDFDKYYAPMRYDDQLAVLRVDNGTDTSTDNGADDIPF